MIKFILNNETINTDLAPATTVLDFVRYQKSLVGTKIGCREGDCGACTILIGELVEDKVHYKTMTSCLMPLGNVHSKHIVTVEGINVETLTLVQQAMFNANASQCGFCTVGFVMSLTGFCLREQNHNYEQAIAAIDGNICRCTGYKSIQRAAAKIVEQLMKCNSEDRINWLVENNYLPEYFTNVSQKLVALKQIKNPLYTDKTELIIAGGTDLLVQKPEDVAELQRVAFVSDEDELNTIEEFQNEIRIGASVTVEMLRHHEIAKKYFPDIYEQTKLVSSTLIRNMASLAGNFVNASPIGDLTVFFLALNAKLLLSGPDGEREVLLKDFYLGYKILAKAEEEHITKIIVKTPKKSHYFNFEKVSKRTYLDIASVNTAISLQVSDEKIIAVHAAAGGVAPYPFYLQKMCDHLYDKKITVKLISESIAIAVQEVAPISDVRGSAEYKKLLLRQLLYAHFIKLFPDVIDSATLTTLLRVAAA